MAFNTSPATRLDKKGKGKAVSELPQEIKQEQLSEKDQRAIARVYRELERAKGFPSSSSEAGFIAALTRICMEPDRQVFSPEKPPSRDAIRNGCAQFFKQNGNPSRPQCLKEQVFNILDSLGEIAEELLASAEQSMAYLNQSIEDMDEEAAIPHKPLASPAKAFLWIMCVAMVIAPSLAALFYIVSSAGLLSIVPLASSQAIAGGTALVLILIITILKMQAKQ